MNTNQRIPRGILTIAVALCAAGASTADERVAAMVEAELARDGVGGLSVGVVEGDRLVYAAGFGHADVNRKIPAGADHVYRIGSITKQFTAYALLALAQDGTLSLIDPVVAHVPAFGGVRSGGYDVSRITLFQLATMTSGLAREPSNLESHLLGAASEWDDVVRRALADTAVEHAPDTRYQYSNIGYAVLGLALQEAARQDYMDYVRERLLVPLGMLDTDFVPRPRFEDRIATGYVVHDDGRIDDQEPAWEHLGRGYKVPNGALYSTVEDLARFVSFQLGRGPDSVLPRSVLEDNFAYTGSATGDLSSGYGIGFSVVRRGELAVVGHGGSVAGYRASAVFDRASGKGVVVLRNVSGGALDVSELSMRILELVAAD